MVRLDTWSRNTGVVGNVTHTIDGAWPQIPVAPWEGCQPHQSQVHILQQHV